LEAFYLYFAALFSSSFDSLASPILGVYGEVFIDSPFFGDNYRLPEDYTRLEGEF